jgi:hypothetical protein
MACKQRDLLHICGLGFAMRDFSPAYLLSCVVEVMSWKAPLRERAFLQTTFPCDDNAADIGYEYSSI